MLYKPLRVILPSLFILAFLSLTASHSNGFEAFCTRVVDGDTLEFKMPKGKLRLVNLIGVKTPDLDHPYGKDVAEFTRKLVEKKQVKAKFGKYGSMTDRQGNLLCYVWIERKFLNEEIIKNGYGYIYFPFHSPYKDRFRHYELWARSHKIGIWKAKISPVESSDIDYHGRPIPSIPVRKSQPSIDSYCLVRKVIDGDTIVVEYKGKSEKVRFLCVNTPESVHPDKKQNVPMGKVASRYTKNNLLGEKVGLEFEGRRRGNYGRLLAYVIIDGVNFNIELVKQGLSPYYTKYGLSKKYDRQFREAERYARKHRLNIWGDPYLARKYLRLKSKWGQKRPPPREKDYSIAPSSGKYVGSKRSNKFHYPSCRWAKKISPGNRVYFNSRQEALDRGYVPCKVCGP